MTLLSVNVNKVALLRNQRDLGIPSVIGMARLAIAAGADGITVHPRPDERHIRRSDVYELAKLLGETPSIEFNIEGNPYPEFMDLVLEVGPAQCTLVPDSPEQNTSDHGFLLRKDAGPTGDAQRLRPLIEALQERGIRVSIFMDPDLEQIEAAGGLGPDRIELYTEPYARGWGTPSEAEVLATYAQAAARAGEVGMGVNAGHDLNLDNLSRFHGTVPNLLEVSIGHALVADALERGMDATVKAYLQRLGRRANGRSP